MCEVTAINFMEILPKVMNNIKQSKFICIDTEFSCLTASHKLQNSLFDSPSERYIKLKATVEQMIPLQIGVTAFTFNPDQHSYTGHSYTFYVFPRPFAALDRKFLCQSSSFRFLNMHGFDFNKVVHEGISFLSRTDEKKLRNSTNEWDCASSEVENLLEGTTEPVNSWLGNAAEGDVLHLKIMDNFIHNNTELMYYIRKEIRRKNLCAYVDSEGFKVKKMRPPKENLEDQALDDLLGFTKVFRQLVAEKKPIVGHNLLLDIMVLIHNCEEPLPQSYTAFKQLANNLFPTIFDSKHMSFEVSKLIPEQKKWNKNVLQDLYDYFKNARGRHLATNSPIIVPSVHAEQSFHNAGYDSYCTGYIFIRMAHVFAVQEFEAVKHRKFMSSELLKAIDGFKNCINVIRGDLAYIKLDGKDPVSRRPPWLIVQACRNKPFSVGQVAALLSTYGYVEVRPYSVKGHRAIVAVDNFGSARRILTQFQSHSEFKIQQYSVLKHSPLVKTFLWSSVIISGAALAWYGFVKLR